MTRTLNKTHKFVVIHKDQWAVMNPRQSRPLRILPTQQEAIDYASSLKDTKHIYVQGVNGRFVKSRPATIKHLRQKEIITSKGYRRPIDWPVVSSTLGLLGIIAGLVMIIIAEVL